VFSSVFRQLSNPFPRNSAAIRWSGTIPAAQAMDALVNASFASPLANANLKIPISGGDGGFLTAIYNGYNAWTVALTLLLTLVAYDQCALHAQSRQILFLY
jgi:hypothetical protein